MGQAVIVTGAAGGLGAFVTRAFLAAGAAVAGISRSIAASAFDHPNFHAQPGDLISAEGARAAVEGAVARLGRVDVLAHVAGGFSGGDPVWETTDAIWDRMMDLNLRAAFNTFRAALPFMREAGPSTYSLSQRTLFAVGCYSHEDRSSAFDLRRTPVRAASLFPAAEPCHRANGCGHGGA